MMPRDRARINPLKAPAKINTFIGFPNTAKRIAATTIKMIMNEFLFLVTSG
jgi:hypothetical protein